VIENPRDDAEFACAHCGELLVVSFEHKLVLANPDQTFVDLTTQSAQSRPADAQWGNQISASRRRRASELALERTMDEKDRALKGFVYGILLVVFGGLLMVIAFLRYSFLSDDWLNIIGFGLGLVFIPLGAYTTVWFSLMARSKGKEEAEIIRDRESLEAANSSSSSSN
jgi:hypothetical protein